MESKIIVAQTKKAVARQFAEDLVAWSADQRKFTIALSGGSTPKVLFELLAAEYVDKLNWENLYFFWGDERCVSPTDEDSNFKMTNDTLFEALDGKQLNIFRIKGESDPRKEARRYGAAIQKTVPFTNRLPQFDLIMLGMGADGHTASIFPNQIHLLNSNRICEVATHPTIGQERITLTGRIINNADRVAFLVTGESKRARVAEILQRKGDWMFYPSAHIQPVDGQLYWYLDEAATGA